MTLSWDKKLVPRRSLPGALFVSTAAPGLIPEPSNSRAHYPRTQAEAAAGVTPKDYGYPPGVVERYGADPTGAVSSAAAINDALKCGPAIAESTYLLSGTDQIRIPAGRGLTSRTGRGVFNITANPGVEAVAHAAFEVAEDAELAGFVINYPHQTATDDVAAIIRYPPTFTVGSYGRVRDLHVTGAYVLCSQQSPFAEIFLEDIVAYSVLFRGLEFSGNADMGDTSRAHNVQIVLGGVSPQCHNDGPVQLWCRQHAVGVYASLTAGKRIDGFQLSNFNVIGGSVGYEIGDGAWFQGSSISADICVQSILNRGQFYIDNLWCSVQDNSINLLPNMPAIRNSGILQITGGRVGMQAANAQNALFVEAGIVDIANVWFATSRGGFTPCLYNQQGSVKLSGCTLSTVGSTGGKVRALCWQDCVVGDLPAGRAQVWIDGKGSPVGPVEELGRSMPGFDMSRWPGGLPAGWSTNLPTQELSRHLRDLFPIEGAPGIEVHATSPAAFYLSYELPPAIDDLFGFWLLTFAIKLVGTGQATASAFDITMSDRSGAAVYRLPVSWGGAQSEPLGIPTEDYYAFGGLLCAPLGTSPGAINLNFKFLSASNQKLRIRAPALFGMKPPPGCSGAEYFLSQECLPRDIQTGPIKLMRRAAAPAATAGWSDGDTVQRAPQALGHPRGWVYLASSAAWVSLGDL